MPCSCPYQDSFPCSVHVHAHGHAHDHASARAHAHADVDIDGVMEFGSDVDDFLHDDAHVHCDVCVGPASERTQLASSINLRTLSSQSASELLSNGKL